MPMPVNESVALRRRNQSATFDRKPKAPVAKEQVPEEEDADQELDLDGIQPDSEEDPAADLPPDDAEPDPELDLDGLEPEPDEADPADDGEPEPEPDPAEDDPGEVPVDDTEPEPDAVVPTIPKPKKNPFAKKTPAAPAAPVPDSLQNEPAALPSDISAMPDERQTLNLRAAQLAEQERQRRDELSLVDQPTVEDAYPTSGDNMQSIGEQLRNAGLKFGLQNMREEMLIQFEDLGMIAEAKRIARIDAERMTSLTSVFIPAGKLIPTMFQLGWKPVHKTGIDENYPPQERYDLTLTNGLVYITVTGRYDWSNMLNTTKVRYATDGELRKYGLADDADGGMFQAAASAGSNKRIKHVPSQKFFGRANASQHPVLYDDYDLNMSRNDLLSAEFGSLASGDPLCVECADGSVAKGVVLGFVASASGLPAALCKLEDGYAFASVADVYAKG